MANKKLSWCFKLKDGLKIVEPKIKTINLHKDKRIDAQYYIKVDQENRIIKMLQEAKFFVASFDDIVSNLYEGEIKEYRTRISQ